MQIASGNYTKAFTQLRVSLVELSMRLANAKTFKTGNQCEVGALALAASASFSQVSQFDA